MVLNKRWVILLFVLLCCLVADVAPRVSEKVVSALKIVWDSLGGAGWKDSAKITVKWNFSTEAVVIDGINTTRYLQDPCSNKWSFLVCKGEAVTSLTVNAFSLNGTMPAALGSLFNLTYLKISTASSAKGKVMGTIPSDIGELASLETLIVDFCSISGTLPSEIFGMTRLKSLQLSNLPLLAGTLPTQLYSMNGLTSIKMLSLPRLDPWTIPTAINSLRLLSSLTFSYINLRGSLPILDLPMLSSVQISSWKQVSSRYNISGHIPEEWADLPSLRSLSLRSNDLTGTIPASFSRLAGLSSLDIAYNRLSGPFPAAIANMSNKFSAISVNNNQLSGLLPKQWRILESPLIWAVDLSSNRFTGPIPDIFCKAYTALGLFFIEKNEFSCYPFTPCFASLSFQDLTDMMGGGIAANVPPPCDKQSACTRLGLNATLGVQSQGVKYAGYALMNTFSNNKCADNAFALAGLGLGSGADVGGLGTSGRFSGLAMQSVERYGQCVQLINEETQALAGSFRRIYIAPGGCGPLSFDVELQEFRAGDLSCSGIPSITTKTYRIGQCGLVYRDAVLGREHSYFGEQTSYTLSFSPVGKVINASLSTKAWSAVSWPAFSFEGYLENVYATVGNRSSSHLSPSSCRSPSSPSQAAPAHQPSTVLYGQRLYRVGVCLAYFYKRAMEKGTYQASGAFRMGCGSPSPRTSSQGEPRDEFTYQLFDAGFTYTKDLSKAIDCCAGRSGEKTDKCERLSCSASLQCAMPRKLLIQKATNSSANSDSARLRKDKLVNLESPFSWIGTTDTESKNPFDSNLTMSVLVSGVCQNPMASELAAGWLRLTAYPAPQGAPVCGTGPVYQQVMQLNQCLRVGEAPPLWARVAWRPVSGAPPSILLYTYADDKCSEDIFSSHLIATMPLSAPLSTGLNGEALTAAQCLMGEQLATFMLIDPTIFDVNTGSWSVLLELFANPSPLTSATPPELTLQGYRQDVYSSSSVCLESRSSTIIQSRVFTDSCLPYRPLGDGLFNQVQSRRFSCKFGLRRVEDKWVTGTGYVSAFSTQQCNQLINTAVQPLPIACISIATARFGESYDAYCTYPQSQAFLRQIEDQRVIYVISTTLATLSGMASLLVLFLIFHSKKKNTKMTVYNKMLALLSLSQLFYDCSFLQPMQVFSTTAPPDQTQIGFVLRGALIMRIFGTLSALLTNFISLSVAYVIVRKKVFPLRRFLWPMFSACAAASFIPALVMYFYEYNLIPRTTFSSIPGTPSIWATNLFVLRAIIIGSILFNLVAFSFVALNVYRIRHHKSKMVSEKRSSTQVSPMYSSSSDNPVSARSDSVNPPPRPTGAASDPMVELCRRLLLYPLIQTATQLPVLFDTFTYAQMEQQANETGTERDFRLTDNYRAYEFTYAVLAPLAGLLFAVVYIGMQPSVRAQISIIQMSVVGACRNVCSRRREVVPDPKVTSPPPHGTLPNNGGGDDVSHLPNSASTRERYSLSGRYTGGEGSASSAGEVLEVEDTGTVTYTAPLAAVQDLQMLEDDDLMNLCAIAPAPPLLIDRDRVVVHGQWTVQGNDKDVELTQTGTYRSQGDNREENDSHIDYYHENPLHTSGKRK